MLNTITQYRNGTQNHNETPLHAYQNKKKKTKQEITSVGKDAEEADPSYIAGRM